MRINTVNGNVIVTQVEKVKEQLPQNVEYVQSDIATILIESMQDKMRIAQLENDLGSAVMEIMTMKMGAM